MNIQVAQAVIKNNDTDYIPIALEEIQNAIRDGYVLCQVDRAIERIRNGAQLMYGESMPETRVQIKGVVKLIKQCCE